MKKQYVVTGMGIVCPVGNNIQEAWQNIINGVAGIRKITSFDTSDCYAHYGAEVLNYQPLASISKKYLKRMDRVSLLSINALQEAIDNSGIDFSKVDKKRVGVIAGSCTGGVLSSEKVHRAYLEAHEKINRLDILKIPINLIGSNLAWYLGVNGPVLNIVNACAATTIAIGNACDLIENDIIDIAIVGGGDTLAALPFSGFHALQALDKQPCAPFSRSGGLTLGEGVGIMVIESLKHARQRNAKIYCQVLGYAINSDAYHITAPHPEGEGQRYVINKALENSNITPKDVDYINAHGTGTPLNDSSEKKSIEAVFAECKDSVSISSTKSMTGHCLGGAGIIEAIFSIKAIENNIIPPTISYENSNPADFDFVPDIKKEKKVEIAISNSFAFGGSNSCVVFSKDLERHSKDVNKIKDKIVISGLGIVSPIGISRNTYWENFNKNISGIHEMEFRNNIYKSQYAAPVEKIDFKKYGIANDILRKLDRLSRLLLLSGKMAMDDARVVIDAHNDREIGLIAGTSDGPVSDIYNFQDIMIKKGVHNGSAFIFPNTVYNAAVGYQTIYLKTKGYSVTFANGIQAGIDSLWYSYNLLKIMKQNLIITSGVDEYSETTQLLYDKLNAITANPGEAKAFKLTAEGFVLGEASTSIILESESHARQRGAECYAEVVGFGFTHSSMCPGKIDPEGRELDRAIAEACDEARIQVNEIDAIVSFANGSKSIDMMELNSYMRVFKEKLSSIPLYTIKNLVGEGRAGVSALQVAHAALILKNKQAPRTRSEHAITMHYRNKEIQIIENEDINVNFRNILVCSYAFGGSYGSVILRAIC